MESRRVPVGAFKPIHFSTAPPPPPPIVLPPAILHACTESRSYLEQYYVRFSATDSSPRYVWVNLDLDTLCMRQRTLVELPRKLPPIKHLSIDCNDSDYFYDYAWRDVDRLPFLEDLEIRPVPESRYWWAVWYSVMRDLYYHNNPSRYRTTIIRPVDTLTEEVPEINPENYLKVQRHYTRIRFAEMPDTFPPDFEAWDSDDEECHPGWRHVPGCGCSSDELYAPTVW
jgi:2EXR family protein